MFLFLTQLTLLKELKEHFENTHLNGKKKHILDTYAELSNVLERMLFDGKENYQPTDGCIQINSKNQNE